MAEANNHSIYQFSAKNSNGEEVSFEKYKGKVVMIVNVATKCGFAKSNYPQFKELLDKYKLRGFEMVAFPCNQFGGQEPQDAAAVTEGVKTQFQFEPDFYEKIDVNGSNEHPIYTFLKKEKGGSLIDAIKWNFTKFLIDKKGHVIGRYAPTTQPKSIEGDIEKALNESA